MGRPHTRGCRAWHGEHCADVVCARWVTEQPFSRWKVYFCFTSQATIRIRIHPTMEMPTMLWRRILIRWGVKKVSLSIFFSLLLICWLDWSLMRIVDLIWQNIFLFSFLVALQVKNNQKLWDHKVKQLLKRDEENEENDDNQDDNPNDVERTWWGEWVNTKMSSFLSIASNVWAFYHL